MKMSEFISVFVFGLLITSCSTQQKTVQLANGKMVTQRQYDKMLNHAFNEADKAGRRAVKGEMSKNDIDSLNNELEVVIDTTQN
jgi:hypothetical protein